MPASAKRLAPFTLAAAVAIAAAGLWASQPAGGGQPDQPAPDRPRREGQPGGRPGGPGERPTVGQSMRMMNRGVNQLKLTIGDPAKKDESLAAVWMIQRGCLGAKASKPENVKGDPAQTLDAFRRGQIKLMGMLLELETAVLDGKTEEAKALLAKAAEHRDASHEFLGVEEEEGGDDAPPPGRDGGRGGEGGGGGGGGGG